MEKHSIKAVNLFKSGYNCAQSVLGAFCEEFNMDFETAMKLTSSLGAGMGRLREVCGAVSGMFLVAGLKYGYTDPKDYKAKTKHYKLIQELAEEFKQKNKYIVCKDLLGLTRKDGYTPEKRTEEYYKKRPCSELVGCAAEILDELFEKENREDIKNENCNTGGQ